MPAAGPDVPRASLSRAKSEESSLQDWRRRRIRMRMRRRRQDRRGEGTPTKRHKSSEMEMIRDLCVGGGGLRRRHRHHHSLSLSTDNSWHGRQGVGREAEEIGGSSSSSSGSGGRGNADLLVFPRILPNHVVRQAGMDQKQQKERKADAESQERYSLLQTHYQ